MIVLGCVSDRDFRVFASQGSGIFYWVGTKGNTNIKGTLQDELVGVGGVEVAIDGSA